MAHGPVTPSPSLFQGALLVPPLPPASATLFPLKAWSQLLGQPFPPGGELPAAMWPGGSIVHSLSPEWGFLPPHPP